MSTHSPSRRTILTAAGVTAAAAAAGVAETVLTAPSQAAIPGPTSYSATWASVDQHPAAPEWFQDAKFGIYYHWGVFSVPAYGDEWYGRRMYTPGDSYQTHHRNVFGEPAAWPYHFFIDGGRDKSNNYYEFAPRLRSAGGNFDPTEWAQLFVDAGAKFAGPVAEHHDGYSMWNSRVNEWNSVGRGPGLDLMKLHVDAIRAKGLKIVVAMHHAFNHTGFYEYAPSQSNASLRKLYGQLGSSAQNQLWYDKLKEVIDQARPDILWQDFNLNRIDEGQRLRFLAYYYNQAVAWDKEVVVTYKDGFNDRGAIYDYERGGPAGLTSPYWLTDDSISSSSWCYTTGMRYYSLNQMLHSLIDRVSKNGNMLLNIAPQADGTIPQGQRSILLSIGDYLRRFGESIYSTRAWTTFGEGPTRMGGGSFTTPRAGTAQDIRYTRSKNSRSLFATVLGWPGGSVNLASLSSSRINLSTLTSVQLLGSSAGSYINLPNRSQDGNGLRITLPSSAPFSAPAYVVKLTFSGTIPGSGGGTGGGGGTFNPTTYQSIRNVTNGLALDSGGNVAAGSQLKQWTADGSTNLQWQVVDSGGGYYRLVNRTNGMVADSYGNTVNGSAVAQAPWNGGVNQQWQVTAQTGGRYRIVNRGTGLGLDGGGQVASGSGVIAWAVNSSTNQLWTIAPA